MPTPDPIARGAEFECSDCGDKLFVMLPTHDYDQAETLLWVVTGDERFYKLPQGGLKPQCISHCCGAPIKAKLLGFEYDDPDTSPIISRTMTPDLKNKRPK